MTVTVSNPEIRIKAHACHRVDVANSTRHVHPAIIGFSAVIAAAVSVSALASIAEISPARRVMQISAVDALAVG